MNKYIKKWFDFAYKYHFDTHRKKTDFSVQDEIELNVLLKRIRIGNTVQINIDRANKLSKKESKYKTSKIMSVI